MVGRFRIATFNMENLEDRPRDGAAGLDDRLAVLRPQFERMRADVLCLQEVGGSAERRHGPRQLRALDRLLAGTPYEGHHRVVSLNRQGVRHSDHHNLVILSRFPVLSHAQVWHDLVEPPLHRPKGEAREVTWDRPLLHARLDLGGERALHVLCLHLRAPRAAHLDGQKDHGVWKSVSGWAEGFTLAAFKRAGQALEARLVVDQIFDEDPGALIAVCGDFNASDHETPTRTIRGDEEDTGNGHLAARVLVPLDRSISESQRFSAIHHGRRIMLDHILVSRPLLGWFRAAEIHNEALGDELVSPALVRGAPDSFHAPMVAEFEGV
ncbi:MAG: endonuclease/exonuclease/phosphatase family protein [Alphaproteobacteria bacterium]|nr:endonuclease/exonuclease/phosphatase family protein [Alphaproteobacteria bacterium]